MGAFRIFSSILGLCSLDASSTRLRLVTIKDISRHCKMSFGKQNRPWWRAIGPALACAPSTASAHEAPCGNLGADARSSSQLENPCKTYPGTYNNSAHDCLFFLIPMIVQCFFSVFSSGNLSFLTRQSHSSEQPSEND